jgi:hypothetical protein
MNQNINHCPQCEGNVFYPMLVGWKSGEPKTLCAHEFHREWLDMAFHPSIWRVIKSWFQRYK